ncbi:MAG: isoprenyl transferase [bacterium]
MPKIKHVAIIMDGNGRWAKKRGLPRVVGHRQGVESVRTIVNATKDLDIKFLTLYTFSTENWQRPEKEINTLMEMLEEMIRKETAELHKNDVKVNAIGRLDTLYPKPKKAMEQAIEKTKNNKSLVMTLCLSYSGRSEIVDAVKKIVKRDRDQKIDLDDFKEENFSKFLYDPELPDPEFLIRTGAENRERISNFLLWQIAYTEVYFTKTLWPDFRKKEFVKAVQDFEKRERLFGRIK